MCGRDHRVQFKITTPSQKHRIILNWNGTNWPNTAEILRSCNNFIKHMLAAVPVYFCYHNSNKMLFPCEYFFWLHFILTWVRERVIHTWWWIGNVQKKKSHTQWPVMFQQQHYLLERQVTVPIVISFISPIEGRFSEQIYKSFLISTLTKPCPSYLVSWTHKTFFNGLM